VGRRQAGDRRPRGTPRPGESRLSDREPPPARCAMMTGMTETPADDGLDRLSSKELHDLAVRRAKRHVDVRFFWHLMEVLPAAEAVAGQTEDEQVDMQFALAHIDDVTDAGEGEVAEQLRPFYVEYLRRHGVKAP